MRFPVVFTGPAEAGKGKFKMIWFIGYLIGMLVTALICGYRCDREIDMGDAVAFFGAAVIWPMLLIATIIGQIAKVGQRISEKVHAK